MGLTISLEFAVRFILNLEVVFICIAVGYEFCFVVGGLWVWYLCFLFGGLTFACLLLVGVCFVCICKSVYLLELSRFVF